MGSASVLTSIFNTDTFFFFLPRFLSGGLAIGVVVGGVGDSIVLYYISWFFLYGLYRNIKSPEQFIEPPV